MKRRPIAITLALATALLLSIAAQLLLAQRDAHAVDIKNFNAATIEGKNICAGPPVAGDPLVYTGGQWCDGVPNNTPLNFFNNAGVESQELAVDQNNIFLLGDGTNPVRPKANTLFEVGAGGLGWNQGLDFTELNAPRSTVTLYFNPPMTSVVGFGQYKPSVAIHLRSWTIDIGSGPTGCTTSAKLEIDINGTPQASSLITLVNGTSDYTVSGLTIPVTANTPLFVSIQQAASGCTTSPSGANVVMEFTTD